MTDTQEDMTGPEIFTTVPDMNNDTGVELQRHAEGERSGAGTAERRRQTNLEHRLK